MNNEEFCKYSVLVELLHIMGEDNGDRHMFIGRAEHVLNYYNPELLEAAARRLKGKEMRSILDSEEDLVDCELSDQVVEILVCGESRMVKAIEDSDFEFRILSDFLNQVFECTEVLE